MRTVVWPNLINCRVNVVYWYGKSLTLLSIRHYFSGEFFSFHDFLSLVLPCPRPPTSVHLHIIMCTDLNECAFALRYCSLLLFSRMQLLSYNENMGSRVCLFMRYHCLFIKLWYKFSFRPTNISFSSKPTIHVFVLCVCTLWQYLQGMRASLAHDRLD